MTVYLVGAGPGDPGLITRRGAQLLSKAHAVVYDRLASPSLLGLAAPDAELFDVGKHPDRGVQGFASTQQERINKLLIELGRRHQTVVRLKGGDPFIFGRGGEEALALEQAGIDYSVVPGVSSAFAVAAYAGVPLTHRGVSASFTVVTGHRAEELEPVAWQGLAQASDTLVILMGVQQRELIAQRLMDGGRPATSPVLVVRWGSWATQEVQRMTLSELGQASILPPATIVIGEVAAMELKMLSTQPLRGLRVAVTRSVEQASGLVATLEDLGAEVIALPAIKKGPPDDGGRALADALSNIECYDWLVSTSPNGARAVLAALPDARSLFGVKIAAIGPGTADVFSHAHLVADLVPEKNIGEGLVQAFPKPPRGGGRVLLARAGKARAVVPDGLRAIGWTVDVVEAYRTLPAEVDDFVAQRAREADVVTFTSASTVKYFCAAVGQSIMAKAVCIGPITSDAAREAGFDVVAEAAEHTLDGLQEALLEIAPAIRLAKHRNKLTQ